LAERKIQPYEPDMVNTSVGKQVNLAIFVCEDIIQLQIKL